MNPEQLLQNQNEQQETKERFEKIGEKVAEYLAESAGSSDSPEKAAAIFASSAAGKHIENAEETLKEKGMTQETLQDLLS